MQVITDAASRTMRITVPPRTCRRLNRALTWQYQVVVEYLTGVRFGRLNARGLYATTARWEARALAALMARGIPDVQAPAVLLAIMALRFSTRHGGSPAALADGMRHALDRRLQEGVA